MRDCLARRLERAIQNVERLVLHPARLGIVLRNLAIAAAEHAAICGDHETGGAGGARIDGENGLHGAKATVGELHRHHILGAHALAALGKVLIEKADERALLRVVRPPPFSPRLRGRIVSP